MKKRITARANDSDIDAIMHNAPIEDLRFIDRCTEITEQIFRMLDARHWKQKDLAAKMSKSEAEISKLLSGTHNLTLRTIAHIETILDENIILTKAGIELKEENSVPWITLNHHLSVYDYLHPYHYIAITDHPRIRRCRTPCVLGLPLA